MFSEPAISPSINISYVFNFIQLINLANRLNLQVDACLYNQLCKDRDRVRDDSWEPAFSRAPSMNRVRAYAEGEAAEHEGNSNLLLRFNHLI